MEYCKILYNYVHVHQLNDPRVIWGFGILSKTNLYHMQIYIHL